MKQFCFIAFACMAFAVPAFAATPALSLNPQGDGDNVSVNITGDPNQSILLSYVKTNLGSQIIALGTTNAAGSYTGTISTSGYGIAPSSSVYVTIGGVNGLKSPSVAWPYSSTQTTTSNSFTLSQTGLVLAVGQSNSITVTNSGSSYLYLSNNSNPSVANVNIGGTQITVFANTYGSTVATICTVGNSANCASIYITVQNTGSSALTFSQNSVTIAAGQNVPITISGGNGLYMVQNNSNSSAVQTSMNGNTITLSTSSTGGLASITVCSTDLSACGIINVTVGSVSTTPLTFSQQNLSMQVGNSTTDTVSGGPTGSVYYISSNQNSNVVQATMPANSNVITLTAIANGSSIITVCSSLGSCSAINVTVAYVSSGGALSLSQSTLSLLKGQTLSITISGGTTPYNLLSASSNVYSASLNGNVLSVTGVNSGSDTVTVCSAGAACIGLAVTVNSIGAVAAPKFSPGSVSISAGNSATVAISGNGGYYVASNSSPTSATVQISGSNVLVYALGAGGTMASICQNGGQCSTLTISVASATEVTPTPAPVSPVTPTPVALGYNFTQYLTSGSNGSEVLQLQKVLVGLGYLKATPNGNFGPATKAAVIAFQKAKGLNAIGVVGPATRAALNNSQQLPTTATTSSSSSTTSSLQAMLDSLKAQLASLKAQAGQ